MKQRKTKKVNFKKGGVHGAQLMFAVFYLPKNH